MGSLPPHTGANLITSTLRLVIIGGLKQHQTEGERKRISKIIREKQRKTAEEERKRKEAESALLCKSCVPDLLNHEPNLPLINPSAPALEGKEKTQEKQKDCVTDYYPLIPYMWPVMRKMPQI